MAIVSRPSHVDRRAGERGKDHMAAVRRLDVIGKGECKATSEERLEEVDGCPRCSGLMFEERIPFQLHMQWTCYNCGNVILGPYAKAPDVLRPLPPEEQPGAYHQNNSRGKAKRSGSHGGKRAAEIAKARKSVRATLERARSRRKS